MEDDARFHAIDHRLGGHDRRLQEHGDELRDLRAMMTEQGRIMFGERSPDGSHHDGLVDKLNDAIRDLASIHTMLSAAAEFIRRLPRLLLRFGVWALVVGIPTAGVVIWGAVTHLAILGRILSAIQQH